jgi:foldase protein PrsA
VILGGWRLVRFGWHLGRGLACRGARRAVVAGGVLLLLVVVVVAGCGGATGGVLARVGGVAITRGMLGHWTRVLAAEYPSLGSERRLLQKRALGFLISSYWLTGEAAQDGRAVSGRLVQARLRARVRSYANGEREFLEALALRAQTPADAAFEIERELASASLHQLAVNGVREVTPAEITGYYEQHKAQYFEGEVRQVVVVESTRATTARRIKRETEQGRALAGEPGYEIRAYSRGLRSVEDALEKELFSARLDVIGGPVAVGPDYFVFEVTKIAAGYELPLSRVAASIRQLLTETRQHDASSAFFTSWSRRWTARTDCSPKYAIPKCGWQTI